MDQKLRELIDQGVTCHRAGHLIMAENIYRQVLRQAPRTPGVIHLMGLIAHQSGRAVEAAGMIRQAILLGGPVPQYLFNLGNVLRAAGDNPAAANAFRDAILTRADYVEAIDNLAATLVSLSQHDEALKWCDRSAELRPNGREGLVNRARAYHDQGIIDRCIASLRQAVEVDPDNADAHSSLVYAQYLDPHARPQEVFEEHQRYARRQAEPFAAEIKPHHNDRNADRRLRIGYLSGDLRSHPVGRFMEPILRQHDRERFEIVCYCDDPATDEVSRRLESLADHWRMTAGAPTVKLAEKIRADRVDILVDLAGHTTGNRLPVFARKPAPVQVSYLGQTATTGLPTVDYLITTHLIHPLDLTPTYCTEELVRLRSFSCWSAPEMSPEVSAAPAMLSGHVTFLSTNNPAKINDLVLKTWARILESVPDSRLILRVALGQANIAVARRLVGHGIAPKQIELVPPTDRGSFLDIYHRADISLDPFPYNGYTTTHESLWMGVPVVTLAGPVLGPSRYGVSLLSAVGLEPLIARSADEYIEVAVALARDVPRLTALRSNLRDRLRASALMDGGQVTRDLESAYRMMWQRWCERGK